MISASSSKEPTPPGKTIKASDRFINSSLRSSNVLVIIISLSLGFANSSLCNDSKLIPFASTPLSRAVSETIFIRPTLPPPKTMLIPLLARISAIFFASSAYLGFLPS